MKEADLVQMLDSSGVDRETIAEVKAKFAELLKEAPELKQAGNKANFYYAVAGLALYQVFVDRGESRDRAVELTREIVHTYARKKLESSLVSKIMLWAVSSFGVFGAMLVSEQTSLSEAQGWRSVRAESSAYISYDVFRCGIYDYYKVYNAQDLTQIFCELDLLGAEFMPSLRLERSLTLASGDELCDFRYFKKR